MPSPAMSKREQNRTAQRERILDAARRVFAERGFEQATMAMVAADAGVARATVFNYFATKHSLVEAITENVFAYLQAMLDAAIADEQSPTPALVRALFGHMAGIEHYRDFYSGVFREIVRIQVGLDEGGAAERTRRAALERLEVLMARGQARGDIAPDPPPADLARAFDSLSNGTIVRWLYDDPDAPLLARMQAAAEIFLGTVALESEASLPPDLGPIPFDPARPTRPTRSAGSAGSAGPAPRPESARPPLRIARKEP